LYLCFVVTATGIAPSTSDILGFSMDIWDYLDLEHCVEVPTDIFASLNLSVVL
jgi:hypothetical protein